MPFKLFTKTRNTGRCVETRPLVTVKPNSKTSSSTTAVLNAAAQQLIGWEEGKAYDVFVDEDWSQVGIVVHDKGDAVCSKHSSSRLAFAIESVGGGAARYEIVKSQRPEFDGFVVNVKSGKAAEDE